MSVKSIFKTLILTVVLIVASSVIIELFNVQLFSTRLANLTKLSASQSAELFAQESYKYEDGGRTTNLGEIRYSAGVSDDGSAYSDGVYLDGNIYDFSNGTSSEEIWYSIYTSPAYEKFVNDFGDNWNSLEIMDMAINHTTDVVNKLSGPVPDWDDTAGQKEYAKATLALLYYTTMYTPLNMGIPYIGEYTDTAGTTEAYNENSTLDRMFRWNLAQLLSNCNPNNIRKDSSGELYVMYNGFRCYASKAKITSVTYEVFDVTKEDDKQAFEDLTSINADNLSFGTTSADKQNLTTTLWGEDDERTNICVAYIEYSLPVSYKGITPIANIFEWIWNNETRVDGYKNTAPTYTEQTWSDSTSGLSGGGAGILTDDNDNNNQLPTTGKLVYYIVR